jgi:hypothetical protein
MSSKMKTGLKCIKCLLTKKHSSLLFESINNRKSFIRSYSQKMIEGRR